LITSLTGVVIGHSLSRVTGVSPSRVGADVAVLLGLAVVIDYALFIGLPPPGRTSTRVSSPRKSPLAPSRDGRQRRLLSPA